MFDTIREQDRAMPTWAAVVVGIVAVVAGVLALAWPGITLAVLDLLFGVAVLVGGIAALVEGVFGPAGSGRGLRAVLGVLGVLVALAVLRYPGDALLVFVFAAGAWLVVGGFTEFLGALNDQAPGRGARALAGVVDVVIGILVLSWPQIGIAVLALLVGIALVVRGVVTVVAALTARRNSAGRSAPLPSRRGATVS